MPQGGREYQKIYHEQSMHFDESIVDWAEKRARRFTMSRACTSKSAVEGKDAADRRTRRFTMNKACTSKESRAIIHSVARAVTL